MAAFSLTACSFTQEKNRETIYQVALLQSLTQGYYDGIVKVSGEFQKMFVRSELKQEKPYKSLDQALSTDQREFHYENIKGTVVALYCPDYMGGLNTPGWHFHFISHDRTKGGHILDLSFETAEAAFDLTESFDLYLSDDEDFQRMELSKDVSDAIKKVETNESESAPSVSESK